MTNDMGVMSNIQQLLPYTSILTEANLDEVFVVEEHFSKVLLKYVTGCNVF